MTDTAKPEAHKPKDTADAADTAREARGSVHEAIGKLIGDDIARDHGSAEKRAGAAAADTPGKTVPRR